MAGMAGEDTNFIHQRLKDRGSSFCNLSLSLPIQLNLITIVMTSISIYQMVNTMLKRFACSTSFNFYTTTMKYRQNRIKRGLQAFSTFLKATELVNRNLGLQMKEHLNSKCHKILLDLYDRSTLLGIFLKVLS